jgi:hypothetical protein
LSEEIRTARELEEEEEETISRAQVVQAIVKYFLKLVCYITSSLWMRSIDEWLIVIERLIANTTMQSPWFNTSIL